MTELSKMLEEYRAGERGMPTYVLEEYRAGERGMPTYDELAALLDKPLLVRVFQSAEQNKQLARDAQSIVDADVAALPKDCSGTPASCPDNEGHGCACSPIAAAPQVVADERAYTAEEARKIFLDQVRHLVSYWERESRETTAKGKLEGLAFSMLNIFDGTTGLPAFDIVCAPHPDDKQYIIDEGSKYFVPGMVINECHLHEMLFSGRAAAPVQAQEPFMFGIMGPDGKAHIDENRVAGDKDSTALHIEVNCLNDSPDTGYSIVPLYRAPVQPVAVPDGKPFAHFVQPSGFGPFIECHPNQVGSFPAYRAAPAAQGDAKDAELARIKRLATCGTVDSFLLLPEQDKRYWFAMAWQESDLRKLAEERIAFLHSTNKDADGYEFGIAKVKFDATGKIESFLWGLGDNSDIDAAIAAKAAS